jgi:hypothetical protein
MDETAEEVMDEVGDDDLRDLVGALHEESEAEVRMLFHYDGEATDARFVRDDVRELYPGEQLDDRMHTLMMKGLGDPPNQGALHDYGDLEATVRLYEEVVVAYFPDDEWSGVIVVLERDRETFVDGILEKLD